MSIKLHLCNCEENALSNTLLTAQREASLFDIELHFVVCFANGMKTTLPT